MCGGDGDTLARVGERWMPWQVDATHQIKKKNMILCPSCFFFERGRGPKASEAVLRDGKNYKEAPIT
jgi:hypothetical protein